MKKIICSVCALALIATVVACFSGCTKNPQHEDTSEPVSESYSVEIGA